MNAFSYILALVFIDTDDTHSLFIEDLAVPVRAYHISQINKPQNTYTIDRLTITQRLKIINTYYKNCDSATAAYRPLRRDYSLHNHPTEQAIGKIVKKFEETGVITNIERPVHHRFARSSENIAIVSEHTTQYGMLCI